jgi:tRNA(fMet)-specific endonuclease VapC
VILLDTDHVTVLLFTGHSQHAGLVSRLQMAGDALGVTVVSFEEQSRGWLAEIARQRRIHNLVPLYQRLTELVEFYSSWDIVPFTSAAADIFADLKKQKIKVGTQDLKIASVALVNNATLLSANLVDFERVPGLRVEDWLYT